MGQLTTRLTVRANDEQASAWAVAARVGGFTSTAVWLAALADEVYGELVRGWREAVPDDSEPTEERASSSTPPEEPAPAPLTWTVGTFRVRIAEDFQDAEVREIEVRGPRSELFGIFRNYGRGPSPKGEPMFSLIHLPTARTIATLQYQRACKAMAAELSVLRVPWEETDPFEVLDGALDLKKVQEIHRRYLARWR